MSGQFQDNFKRDSEEDMLEYDDSAFYYFSLALLTFITVPFLYFLVRTIVYGKTTFTVEGVNCETREF